MPDGKAAALLAEGRARLKARDPFAAVAALEAARALDPVLPELAETLLAAYRRDARYGEAVALADEILIVEPDNGEALFEKAMSLVRLGKAGPALETFDRLSAVHPEHAAGWFNSHGPALDLIGLDDALRRLEIAATRDRANGRYWVFPYVYCLLAGRVEEAQALFRTRLARHPNRRTLSDGVHALHPYLASGVRLFGVSAHLLRFAVGEAKETGLVLEFGVRRGASLAEIVKVAGQPVHGFDSFEGLPEAWVKGGKGALTTGASLPDLGPEATLHPGWFEDVLPGFLADHGGAVRFVNIDSDLYSSARTVLTALAPRFRAGSVLVFDEMIGNRSWADDEYKAFQEFIAISGFSFEVIAIAPFTKQVAIRLSR